MAKNVSKNQKPANNPLSVNPYYELPQTKAVLKPLIDAGESVADALSDGHINFAEWATIAWNGVPLITALRNLEAFIAETRILNTIPEAMQQLYDWFEKEFNLPVERQNVEMIVEHTIELAVRVWRYIAFMQQNFVQPKRAAKEAK